MKSNFKSKKGGPPCKFGLARTLHIILDTILYKNYNSLYCLDCLLCCNLYADDPDDEKCTAFAPIWETLAERFADSADFMIAKINIMPNEVDGVNIREFPDIKYFNTSNPKVGLCDGYSY